jgi:two-component system, OmpR family, sensor histidine kinase BaeS
MKRSLSWKLSAGFVLVAITVSLLVSVSLRFANPAQFNTLVVSQQRSDFRSLLVTYYTTNHSWRGVDAYIKQQIAKTFPDITPQPNGSAPSGFPSDGPSPNGPFPRDWRNQFGLADANGIIQISIAPLYPLGQQISAATLAQGEAIAIDGQTVGTILTAPRPPNLSPEEAAYLQRVNIALALASAGAFLVALLMGLLLARTLTQPLRALTQAAHRMAAGDLEQEVTSSSQDEIGELAAAFNQMSRAVAQANLARRQMAVDVAHELRTPLTVVSGYIESMRDGVLAPSQERLAVIYSEIEHLQRLVEDLRILSQADAGELKVHKITMPPKEFLRQIQATFEQLALQKGIAMALDAQTDLAPIAMDETRMEQVVSNLISNALRHTPPQGQITLGAQETKTELVLSVTDTGTGIAPKDLPHIFDRFYRADDGGSTGLGLAIARALVAAHGGTIEAESTPDIGTVIRIHLPRFEQG